jgi:GNAT superfamily N-acetyltransferase
VDRFDYNYVHSLAIFASTSRVGESTETRDVLLTNTRAPVADFNQVYLKTPAYKLDRTLDRVDAFQERGQIPLRLNLASEHEATEPQLRARGYTPADSVPAMILEGPVETPTHDALRILRVQDAQGLLDFAQTSLAGFGFPTDIASVVFTPDLLALPHAELFVGYVADRPVCTSMLLLTGAVAGIYWVATDAAHRGHGYGAAITSHAVMAGRARGGAIASLQASVLGAPVYRRLGFVEIRRYLRFDRQGPPNNAHSSG